MEILTGLGIAVTVAATLLFALLLIVAVLEVILGDR